MPSLYPIRYVVSGGTLQVDLTFEVAENGASVVEILTESSLPQTHPVRLGRFAGQLAADTQSVLADWARTLQPSAAPVLPFDSVSRSVATAGVVSVVGSVPAGLDEGLAAAAVEALAHPLAAIQVQADNDQLTIVGL